jgi:hypothetical protein
MKIIDIKTNNTSIFCKNKTNMATYYNKKASDTIMPVSSKEWNNSIYNYNKNKIKHLPNSDNYILKLIKSYFNFLSSTKEKNIKFSIKGRRARKNLGTKFWISKTDVKHTNDYVLLNIYTFNNKNNFLIKNINNTILDIHSKKINKLDLNKSETKSFNQIIMFYKNELSTFFQKLKDTKSTNNNKIINTFVKYLHINIYTKFIQRILNKELLLLYYKQYILYSLYKSKDTYIIHLNKLISKIYNKRVIFNIVNLKSCILDSNILTQIIATKAKNRKNRAGNILELALSEIDAPSLSRNLIGREKRKLNFPINLTIKNSIALNHTNNDFEILLKNIYTSSDPRDKDMKVIESFKNKTVTGIRLEASGRLTKRFTAQRSISNTKYKGTLKSIDSAYKGWPTKSIRNNITSNVQYSFKRANNRIGAFGFKGWISSL